MRIIPFGRPIIEKAEKEAVLSVLNSHKLVHGMLTKKFELVFAEFLKAPQAVSVASCTAALQLAYFYLDIGPGDEVIVPAQTHVATAHAVELNKAKCVFVDSELETGNIDIHQIEAHITRNTKAISVVHFLGMPVNMDQVNHIAKKYNLFVVEDCALGIGAWYKSIHVGLHGDIGCFSFYPVKHMTTIEGGMVITKHARIAEKIRQQKMFGINQAVDERSVPGVYDVEMLGFNFRMNEVQAAMGIEQVKRLDFFMKKRYQNYKSLSCKLREIDEIQQLRSSCDEYQSSYYCLSILLSDLLAPKRMDIIKKLNAKGVGTSIYYPKPVPYMMYYKKKYQFQENGFPNAEKISYNSIALPVGPHLSEEDMEYIATQLKEVIYQELE